MALQVVKGLQGPAIPNTANYWLVQNNYAVHSGPNGAAMSLPQQCKPRDLYEPICQHSKHWYNKPMCAR